MRREGRCFNYKRRGHVSTTYSEDEELSKKTKKTIRVVRATSSDTKEKKKTRKARKEESSSNQESCSIETFDKDSDSGKE